MITIVFLAILISTNAYSVCIVQNKGGGHGELGFHLAKDLIKNGKANDITILQDTAAKMSSQPFCEYTSLTNVNIIPCDLSDTTAVESALNGKSYKYMIDNFSKDISTVETLLKCSEDYLYVSSGGMYIGDCPSTGHTESDDVKSDNACRVIEEYLSSDASGTVPFSSFRPQYIYGTNTNKRGNLDYFYDRISRDIPVPIPGDGTQLIALTNAADVAAGITSVIESNASSKDGSIFNLGTDKFISYNDLVDEVAKSLGKSSAEKAYYDPKSLDFKPAFPFRPKTFTVDPSKLKATTGWSIASDLVSDLNNVWVKQYMDGGFASKDLSESLEKDKLIFA